MPLKENPRLYKENLQYKGKQNKIFPVLLIIKRMLKENEQWQSLIKDLKNTFSKYKGAFKFDFMGFPKNWEEIL